METVGSGIKEITYEEIQLMKEGYCEGCKGVWTFDISGCYETCEGFLAEWRKLQEEKEEGTCMKELIEEAKQIVHGLKERHERGHFLFMSSSTARLLQILNLMEKEGGENI